MIGQRRHLSKLAHHETEGWVGPVGLEVEFPVGMGKTVEIVRGAEIRLQVAPKIGLEPRDVAMSGKLEGSVDQFARGHVKAGVAGIQPACQSLQYLMIAAAFAGRI